MSRRVLSLALGLLCAAALATAAEGPIVANPSFEADRYTKWPGTARQHGGRITGWTWKGSVGINPVWDDPRDRAAFRHAFTDNARHPHGRQAAFIQNIGTLSQRIPGFVKGKRYRVTYYENARHNNAPKRNPRLEVTLGGQVVVSEHRVEPVEPIDIRTLPYRFVESAVFVAPASGAFELVFRTTFGDRVAVLIDHIAVVEVRP